MRRLYHAGMSCQGRNRRSIPVRSRILLDISSIETSVASMNGMPWRSNKDSAARKLARFQIVLRQRIVRREDSVLHGQIQTRRCLAGARYADEDHVGALV